MCLKVPSACHDFGRSRSAPWFAQSAQDLRCQHTYFLATVEHIDEHRRLWADCADGQVRLLPISSDAHQRLQDLEALIMQKPILIFSRLWAVSADDKLYIFFLFLPENWLWYFMQGDNLHEILNPVFWENMKHISKRRLLKMYPAC